MVNYDKIIGLNKNFQPYYDITNESNDYWKSFIPNDKFYELLHGVLTVLDSPKSQDRKSVWIQGTYGTGKSHATGVIKRLLFAQEGDIIEYINNFKDDQLKSKILAFRKKHRVLPVVLKGVSNIHNNSSFSLEIEKSVKKTLRENSVIAQTESDFEKMIRLIKKNSLNIDWNKNIAENPELRMYVTNQDELLIKLESNDNNILQILEELSSRVQIHFSHNKIEEWLINIADELKAQNVADKLMIYWDEFTSVLELQNSGILLSKLQDIAELSSKNGIYLYVVSHRRPQQSQISTADIEHILGRFNLLDYSMEPITTYHIIGAAIKKHDLATWKKLRNKHIESIAEIANIVTANEGPKIRELIDDLFPIHPFTAYLSTFIARNVGSTERSIFNFLYDEKKGFTKFINENPGDKEKYFLTADSLFDFFADDFERSMDQRFSSVLDKYRLHVDKFSVSHLEYLSIFKVILLLNILYRLISLDESQDNLITPNRRNIAYAFAGSKDDQIIDNCLEFINNEQIISRNPDGLFLVESSALPQKEIRQAIVSLKNIYDSIDKILNEKHQETFRDIFSPSIIRTSEIIFVDADCYEHILKSKLEKSFKFEHSLHFAIVIAKSIEDQLLFTKKISLILKEDEFANIIFVILDEILDSETISKFIDYQARAQVANRHNLKEEENSNARYADKLIDQWLNKIKNSTIKWFLRSNNSIMKSSSYVLLSRLYDVVNDELSKFIFFSGLETIKSATRNYPVWSPQMSKNISEIYILANNRQDLEERTSTGPSMFTREILKDEYGQYIVDNDLQFSYSIDANHPLKKMSYEVATAIESMRGEVFNIGDLLIKLSRPPYGLYPNMINIAALSFIIRDYSGKIYESGSGRPIERLLLRDMVCNIFDYWKNNKNGNKLEIRLGTLEEKELISDLCDIFELEKKESLNDVKWAIRDWIKSKAQFPLWVFIYDEQISDGTKTAIHAINYFVEIVDRGFTESMIHEAIETISSVKTDLTILLQKHEHCRELFIRWLNSIDNIIIPKDEHDAIIQYVRENMPEEVGVASWSEDRVREIVKDWFIAKPASVLKSNFIYKKLSDFTPVQVQFIDQSEGNPIFWEWNFNKDNPNEKSTEQFPTHKYSESGEYFASLTVQDIDGNIDIYSCETPIIIQSRPAIDPSTRKDIISKIQDYEGDFKELLIRMVKEHDEIVDIVRKYFI